MKHRAKRKKPTPMSVAWRAQAAWVVEFLEKLQRSPSAHGEKWTRNMILHYCNRFDLLYKNAPRSCRKQATSYKARVDGARDWNGKYN